MRLEQLKYFIMIEQCGSMTKAAENLYLSQPALSKQITLLEEEIGVKLLERHARGIRMTEAGEGFASDCRKILQDLENAVRRAETYAGPQTMLFRIGCFDGAVTDDFLPELLQKLSGHVPKLQIRLTRNSFEENYNALETGQIDMLIELARKNKNGILETISGLSAGQAGYGIRKLAYRESALIYSVLSPLAQYSSPAMADFAEQPFLIGKNKGAEWLAKPTLEYIRRTSGKKPRIEKVDNFMTLMSNVELGHGYCSLARMTGDRRPELVTVNLPKKFSIYVIAVWKKSNMLAEQLNGGAEYIS